MGLDMMIFAKKKGTNDCKEVGYWRKANAIHSWFVTNVQHGKDDCKEYPLSRDNLVELKKICEGILANKKLADTHLPTKSGFFFGNTDYDSFYFNKVESTIEIIDRILNEYDDTWELTYQSSW